MAIVTFESFDNGKAGSRQIKGYIGRCLLFCLLRTGGSCEKQIALEDRACLENVACQ